MGHGVTFAFNRRAGLLASTASILAAAQPAGAQETTARFTLSQVADAATFGTVALALDRPADPFGFQPDVVGLGVAALAGNDTLFLLPAATPGSVVVTLSEFRLYLALPGTGDLLTAFLAPVATTASATLVDAGAGNDRVTHAGAATVSATATLEQVDLDIAASGLPLGQVPISTGATITARADGLADPSGTNRLINAGSLGVTATARGDKLGIIIDPLLSSSVTDVLLVDALATGLAGGTGRDTLENRTASLLSATAGSAGRSLDISASGVTFSEPTGATEVDARATGMDGGAGGDALTNDGAIVATAAALVQGLDIVAALAGLSDSIDGAGAAEAETRGRAVALGMAGAGGSDTLATSGSIIATATATHEEIGLFIDDGGIDPAAIISLIFPPAIDDFASGGAIARAVGMAGDGAGPGGNDSITMGGSITGTATAEAQIISVGLAIPLNDLLGEPIAPVSTLTGYLGLSLSEVTGHASAGATGIGGDAGNDRIATTGAITLSASSDAQATQVNIGILDFLADLGEEEPAGGDGEWEISGGLSVVTTGAIARSTATGIDSGAGADSITAGGTIRSTATAAAQSDTVNIGLSTDERAVQANMTAVFGRTSSLAVARGIDAGTGDDSIVNRAAILATADADTRVIDIGATLEVIEKGLSVSASLLDNKAESLAVATGIASPLALGLENSGDVAARATARTRNFAVSGRIATAAAVSADAGGEGLTATAAIVNSSQEADAVATAIDAPVGAAAPLLLTGGTLSAAADATASQLAVLLDIAYAGTGVALGASVLLADNSAWAASTLVNGGAAGSDLSGFGVHRTTATADADAIDIVLGIGAANKGVAAGVTAVDSDNAADAIARGFVLGSGADRLDLAGGVDGLAIASAGSLRVAIGVAGEQTGVGIGATLASAANGATALTRLLETGAGDDIITGNARLQGQSVASATQTGIDIAVAGASNGVSAGAVLAQGSNRAAATTGLVALGDGADIVDYGGLAVSRALAVADTLGVGVALGAVAQGVAAGAVLSQTQTSAIAGSTALDAGDGDDRVRLVGGLDTSALADASGIGVSVNLEAALQGGVSAGGVLVDAGVAATATGTGLIGGLGNDELAVLQGPANGFDLLSSAVANQTTVAVTLSLTKGLGIGVNYVEAATAATAQAVGIAGDGGEPAATPQAEAEAAPRREAAPENDDINLGAAARIAAVADAQATTVLINLPISVSLSGNIFDGETVARADAAGIDGGRGNDIVRQTGTLTTEATATAGGPTISVVLLGAGLGDVGIATHAAATGIAGGLGDDAIGIEAISEAIATARSGGLLIDVALAGAALSSIRTDATATATAVDAGDGQDSITGSAAVRADAVAQTPARAIAVTLTGAALPEAGSTATARATALETGFGDDRVTLGASAPVAARASATREGLDLAVALLGIAETRSDIGTHATATGIANAGGTDTLDIAGAITADATGTAGLDSIAVSLLGFAASSAQLQASADAAAFRLAGGSALSAAGTVMATATATAQGRAIDVSLLGGADADLSITARGTAAGLAGGSGDDNAIVAAPLTATATAAAGSETILVTLVGLAQAAAGPAAIADAVGLSGGGGADSLSAMGPIKVRADAATTADSIVVNLIGTAESGARSASAAPSARATATAIDGGDGGDRIEAERPDVAANATLAVDGLAITIVGTADSGGAPGLADARATVANGGAGDDALTLGGGRATAQALSTSEQLVVTVAGTGSGDARLALRAAARGVNAGEGADRVTIAGRLSSIADALGGATGYGVTVAGTASAATAVSLLADARGILGGAGADLVRTAGLEVAATATGLGGSDGVVVAGRLTSDASVTTLADARGIEGGEDADDIEMAQTTDVRATATGVAGATSLTIAGTGQADASVTTRSAMTGIDGGGGADRLVNTGTLRLTGSSTLLAGADQLTIAGSGRARAGLAAVGAATGFSGGDGDDLLSNVRARVFITQTSTLTAAGTGLTIFGTAATGGLAVATADLVGMEGGAGADQLMNSGEFEITGTARISLSNASSTIFGTSAAGGFVSADVGVTGFSGGDGNDIIASSAALTLLADAAAVFSGTSYTTFGTSTARALLGATATALGVGGGEGADSITTAGAATDIEARARATLLSDVEVDLGRATGSSPASASAAATGIDGGADADRVALRARLDVLADAGIGFAGSRIAALGSATAGDTITAVARAVGVDGGAGNDVIETFARVTTRATSRSDGFGAAGATFGNALAAAEARATSEAFGILGGTGVDTILAGSEVNVVLDARADSTAEVEGGSGWSDAVARTKAVTLFEGAIIADAGGDSLVTIDKGVSLVIADPGAAGGSRALATSLGSSGIDVEGAALADAETGFFLHGVRLGGGVHRVTLSDALTLSAAPRTFARAVATGNNAFVSDSTTITDSANSSSQMVGIDGRAGTIDASIGGTLSVVLRSTVSGEGAADVSNAGFTTNTAARSTVIVSSNTLEASGVRGAFGNDIVTLSGRLVVDASPLALASAIAAGDDGASFGQDAFTTAEARANDLSAIGIALGEGANRVTIDGTLSVTAAPRASAISVASGFGADGDADAEALAEARRASAIGIATGGGADHIVNRGMISAVAAPAASATAIAVPEIGCSAFCTGEGTSDETATVTSSAWAIRTGGGNDIVESSGTIFASRLGAGDLFAILTEDGDDTVHLSGGRITGAIDLGVGNDRLRVQATTVDNPVQGGTGTDRLELVGAGSLGQTGFERFEKTGAGTFSIGFWGGAEATSVQEGILQVSAGSTFAAGHALSAAVRPDGSNGRLVLLTPGVPVPLGGTLAVSAGAGVYTNGQTWDVVATLFSLSGNFASVTLPANTAQRTWSGGLARSSQISLLDRWRVRVAVQPLATFVPKGRVGSFAAALDAAAPHATGRLAGLLGGLQVVPDAADLSRTVATLAPRAGVAGLATAGTAADGALALMAARPAVGGDFAPAGHAMVGTAPAPGERRGWAAAFDAAPGGGVRGGGIGRWSGFASGMDIRTPGGTVIGMAAIRQGAAPQIADGGGDLAATSIAVGMEAPVGPAQLGWAIAAGASDISTSAAAFGGATRFRQRGDMLAAGATAAWPIAAGVRVKAGLDWRQVRVASYSETGGGALAMALDGGLATRTEGRIGLGWAPKPLHVGTGSRLAWGVDAAYVRRFDPTGERLVGRFADAPGVRIALAGDLAAENSLALSGGLRLSGGSGLVVEAGGTMRAFDVSIERRATVRLLLPFGH